MDMVELVREPAGLFLDTSIDHSVNVRGTSVLVPKTTRIPITAEAEEGSDKGRSSRPFSIAPIAGSKNWLPALAAACREEVIMVTRLLMLFSLSYEAPRLSPTCCSLHSSACVLEIFALFQDHSAHVRRRTNRFLKNSLGPQLHIYGSTQVRSAGLFSTFSKLAVSIAAFASCF